MNPMPPTDEDLHAYVDGRLPAARRDAVAEWLLQDPEREARIAAWKRDAEALRAGWASELERPAEPSLAPTRLRSGVHARQRARLALAASCVLALGLGAFGGWTWRGARVAAAETPMADAVAAYRLFSRDAAGAGGDSAASMQDWLHAHFGAAGDVPDLRGQGFALQGGRRLSTPEGAAAMLVYRDPAGARIVLYLRPRTPRLVPGERRDGSLLAQYWADGDTAFALVGPAAATRMRLIAPLLRGG
jgi:anti-sigma factor RsiW